MATLTLVALCVGVSATAAVAANNASPSLRAQVDAIGARYFAAQARASALDEQMHSLDRRLAQARRRTAILRPAATARAIQLYQGSTQGFTALFDTTSAMESARRAELIARASDHTQALLDEYANSAALVERQRAQVARARAAQAVVVAALAKQEAALEQALARAQQAYRDQLAAQARARLVSTTNRASAQPAPIATAPKAAPPAPVQVAPPPPPESGFNPHHDDAFLVCTRTRESSGNYGAVNSGGYYGAYQFSQPTWDVTASHAGSPQLIGVRPDAASAWDQDQLAWVLYQWQGNAPWGGLC